MVMIRNIMEGKYSLQTPEWDDITGELCGRGGDDKVTFDLLSYASHVEGMKLLDCDVNFFMRLWK